MGKNLKLKLTSKVINIPIKVFLEKLSNAVIKIDSEIKPEIIFLELFL